MNRKRVIEIAANLFLEMGFLYTSMDELVRVSKVSKSNVYYHFSNKEEILESVVDYWIAMYNYAMEEVLNQQQFSVEQRVIMFLTHLSQGVQEREFKGGCPFITLAIQCPAQAIQLKERIGMFFTELQSKVSLLITQGIERGEFRNTIQPEEVAALFITNLEGALFIAETQKDATIIIKTVQQFMQLLR
ncbi:TetR/AcrR family transcriptional regulator [Bacillus salipaludis]|uniref:TetR/AcrR family transcriptional regulator n=1 Tax=Bacillus salipaludis TaxID=2547811 RepID=A0AA90TWL5_9BACI|nr:TetR/AcrR family transcriptional regulator [Bacillus salipaludis]MDQ6600797.1 TetR/AcrR family transcriptional regulator [Bacillus salipaludis]